jgi:HK97 family phage prohead protease
MRVDLELRAATLEGNTLLGQAHVFGTRAFVGGQYEQFAATAFTEVLNRPDADVRAFYNHNTDLLLGRLGAGTLRLSVDGEALNYSIDLPQTTYAEDLKALIARGDLNGVSFGFLPGKFVLGRAADGALLRTHTSVKDLIEVSPVALPAFNGTSVQLRSADGTVESLGSQLVRARARALFSGEPGEEN